MSLLLMGGGCSIGFGARVRQTGRPAAHIRIPVIPGTYIEYTHTKTQKSRKKVKNSDGKFWMNKC